MSKETVDFIYLSPHLDDAGLSCGGQIYQQAQAGASVLVVTLMAGDPPAGELPALAQQLHQRWAVAADSAAARRQEDAASCRLLGCDYLHLDLPDAIYRRHPETGRPFYATIEAIFDRVDEADRDVMLPRITQLLAGLPEAGQIFCPLTVGNHVDHQLTRLAVEQVGLAPLWYYEDYPYAHQPGAVEAALEPAAGWRSKQIPLSEAALQARIEAIAAYASQISSLFAGQQEMAEQVAGYAARVGGERLWFRSRPNAAMTI